MTLKLLQRALILILSLTLLGSTNFADEIVIDDNANSKVSIGDFDCSKCPSPTTSFSLLAGGNSAEFTTGELWTFFNAQGINKLHNLTLCLDLQPNDDSSEFGLESVEFKIQDPSNIQHLLTNVNLGNNSLVVPSYDVTSFKPEVKLEFALGYDFMERFSANSTEKISIDVSTKGDASSEPIFSLEGAVDSGFFSNRTNVFALGVFVGFWILAFVCLSRFTKPKIALPEPKAPTSSASSHQVLSA